MWQYAAKVLVTVAVVVAVSEIGKCSSLWGAVLASLLLTLLLAFVLLYLDTGSSEPIAALSRSIFWLVLASLPLFLVLACHVALGRFVLVQSRASRVWLLWSHTLAWCGSSGGPVCACSQLAPNTSLKRDAHVVAALGHVCPLAKR